MAWTTPVSRVTGDLITASIWNTQVMDNLNYLYARKTTILYHFVPTLSGQYGNLGDHVLPQWSNVETNVEGASSVFFVPTDFSSLDSLSVILVSDTTTSIEVDATSDYGAVGQAYNTHSGSLLNQAISMTANQLTALSATALFASLAAGDYCALKVTASSGANAATVTAVGILLVYNRT